MYDECQFYLQHLDVPQGMSVEVLDVRGATSMTAGYQAAMDASDAKYKIYLHQDSFIVNRNCSQEMLDIFVSNAVLMQKTISGKTAITYFESVPFVTNMYENKSDLFGIDIARIIITIILLLTMFYHIYQKYSSMKVKSIKKLLSSEICEIVKKMCYYTFRIFE